MSDEEFIKPEEVAKRYRVSRQAVYKWIREGRLPAVRLGAMRGVRIKVSDLEAFERRAGEEAATGISEKNGTPGGLTAIAA